MHIVILWVAICTTLVLSNNGGLLVCTMLELYILVVY
jgi:hypothetical protein